MKYNGGYWQHVTNYAFIQVSLLFLKYIQKGDIAQNC